jgi:hypothetical protein
MTCLASRPYLHHCPECRRDFRTGRRWAVLCPSCDAREERAMRMAEAPDDYQPQWTKAAMRERLGVSGDVDE